MSQPEVSVNYYAEYLESDRFGLEEASQALAGYILRKYRNLQVDLVIATTNDSLQFVLKQRDELFPSAPVVFVGLAVPDEAVRRAGHGIAAVRVGSAFAETLNLALELHPSTRRVFVVANSPNKENVDSVRAELGEFSERVPLTYLNVRTLADLRDAVRAVPAGSLILHLWHRLPEGNPDSRDVARLVADAAAVPVYGVVDLNVGTGVVGGVVRGLRETGMRVGQIALRILRGARPQDIAVEDAPLVPMFDGRQLRRWGIDRSRLPPGSNVQFWTPTPWETHREYILGTIAVVAAQLLAIAGLLVQRSKRQRAEKTVIAREATIRASYERIRLLAGRLIHAQESVRAGIARDLHDGVCQELAGMSLTVRRLKSGSGSIQDEPMQKALSKLHNDTIGIVEGVRRLSHDLHPATLHLVGLAGALQAHCTEVEKRQAVQVQCTIDGEFRDVHPDVTLCLFRIVQESLRNAIVHGEAKHLEVSLARSGDAVELAVTDDGCGFDLEAVRAKGNGLGLVSIEERARMIAGEVQIVSSVGRGTTISVRASASSRVSVRS